MCKYCLFRKRKQLKEKEIIDMQNEMVILSNELLGIQIVIAALFIMGIVWKDFFYVLLSMYAFYLYFFLIVLLSHL